jgi:periplasmic protein TonB
MAYADRNTSGSRVVSIVIVSIIVALFAWGFVNGLTFKYIKKVTEKLNTFDVVEPPPPIVRVTAPPPPVVSVAVPPPALVITPRAAAPAPVPVAAPPAPTINKQAGPKGDPSQWVTTDDYPSDALSAEAQGTSKIKWEINTAGRVENCVVVASSGNASLDRAACSNITRRGRYTPALDSAGNPIRSSSSRNVVWRLPQ